MWGWGLRRRRGLLVLLSEGCRIFTRLGAGGVWIHYEWGFGWGLGWDGTFWGNVGGGMAIFLRIYLLSFWGEDLPD